MYEIKDKKNEIRKQYIEKRKLLAPEVKRAYDEKICSSFLSLITYRYADTILMYAPKAQEVNIYRIAEAALADGKAVAFPKCNPAELSMQYKYVTSLSELESGAYGLMEPSETAPVYNKANSSKERAVCLVPGIVFDSCGYRLGYGKGYYDRFFVGFFGTKAGFVYNNFIVDRLPRGKYDINVDVLVTDRGVKITGES